MQMGNHMIQALDKPISPKSLQNCFDFVDYFTPTASHPKLICVFSVPKLIGTKPPTNSEKTMIVHMLNNISTNEMCKSTDGEC